MYLILWMEYSMFSYEEIQKYNETDIRIYKYIVSNIDKIQYMYLLQQYCVFVIKTILMGTLNLKTH